MDCPKCLGTKLDSVSVPFRDRSIPGPDDTTGKIELDMCASCGGVWFDKDELDRYLDSAAKPLPPMAKKVDPAQDSKAGLCPRCAAALLKKPAPSNPRLTVDSCAKCGGLWLDAGELEQAAGKDLPLSERLKAAFSGV
jgi:hypothetical protein